MKDPISTTPVLSLSRAEIEEAIDSGDPWLCRNLLALALLRPTPSEKRRTVWEVSSKTSSILFASRELAGAYLSSFPASIGGGMSVSERNING